MRLDCPLMAFHRHHHPIPTLPFQVLWTDPELQDTTSDSLTSIASQKMTVAIRLMRSLIYTDNLAA